MPQPEDFPNPGPIEAQTAKDLVEGALAVGGSITIVFILWLLSITTKAPLWDRPQDLAATIQILIVAGPLPLAIGAYLHPTSIRDVIPPREPGAAIWRFSGHDAGYMVVMTVAGVYVQRRSGNPEWFSLILVPLACIAWKWGVWYVFEYRDQRVREEALKMAGVDPGDDEDWRFDP